MVAFPGILLYIFPTSFSGKHVVGVAMRFWPFRKGIGFRDERVCAVGADPKLPMLITGLAGVPGYNAFHYFRSLYGDQVIGVRQPNMWPLKGDGIIACDVGDARSLEKLWALNMVSEPFLNSVGSCRLKSVNSIRRWHTVSMFWVPEM